MRGLPVALLALALLPPSGCRRPASGNDWLFRIDGETVTVAEAGAYWDSLPPLIRTAFLSGDNPLGDFVLAYSRKTMVDHELERLGILSDTLMESRTAEGMRLAADTLYAMFVTDSIRITPAMLDSAYAATPPSLPGRRTFVCLSFNDSVEVDVFNDALASGGTAGLAGRFGGLPALSEPDGDPHLTRPLSAREVPAVLGSSLFAATDTTTWFGPVQYPGQETWVAFRLDSVLPARQATLEEAVPELESSIQAAREQARFEEWMRSLEERYGLEVNEDAVNLLPRDPSEWSEI